MQMSSNRQSNVVVTSLKLPYRSKGKTPAVEQHAHWPPYRTKLADVLSTNY